MSNTEYTNKDIYVIVDKLRLELKADLVSNTVDLRQDIRGLRQDFNTMEAGRLTRAENNINKLQSQVENQITGLKANQSLTNGKLIIIWSLIMIALNIIGSFALGRVK